MDRFKYSIKHPKSSVNIFLKDFEKFLKFLESFFLKKIFIVADKNFENYVKDLCQKFHSNNLQTFYIFIDVLEKNKSQSQIDIIEDEMFLKNISKDDLLIGIGGGIITDLSTFIAATYLRGISHALIPTTLLAMTDAAIGGKAAINKSFGKNLIGVFYHPIAIFINFEFLKTLSEIEFNSGLFEIIKIGLIYDKKILKILPKISKRKFLEKIIKRAIFTKIKIIKKDASDTNFRKILNFGHTIGHAIEILENFKIPHGYAVGIGMIIESYISMKLNILNMKNFEKILKLLRISKNISKNISFDDFLKILKRDKKAKSSTIQCVLIKKIGKASYKNKQYSHPIDNEIIKDSFKYLQRKNFENEIFKNL